MKALIILCIALSCPSLIADNNAVKEINMFGTDGIRRTVGFHPFTLDALAQLGSAIARWAEYKYGNNPTILLGHDTRISCDFIKAALKVGLLRHSVTVYDVGVLSTPAVCFLTKNNAIFDCGIVISASHNVHTDNGIKIIDGNNIKLLIEDEQRITELFNDDPNHPVNYNTLGKQEYWHKAEQEYIEQVVNRFKRNFLQGRTIVLDCANGATHKLAPRIFKRCGARVITLHKHPNGTNINNRCGSQHPESLQGAVREYKADAGFAFDGDGDRVIAVSRQGNVKDGDDVLALLLDNPRYADQQYVVGTIMTNEGFNVHLKERNKTLLRTPVGDKYVAQKLEEIGTDLGGEQSGHTILRDYLKTGDGVMTALRVMETIIDVNNMDMHTFERYPQILISIPIKTKKDLTQDPLARIIKKYGKQLHGGRIVVRYSGTENCARVMVEDCDEQNTKDIAHNLSAELQCALAE